MEGTYSSAIMSPWGCFICLAMAASASSTYRSFSESDTFCKATSRCSGCRPSCSPARSCESHKKGLGGGGGGRGLSGHRPGGVGGGGGQRPGSSGSVLCLLVAAWAGKAAVQSLGPAQPSPGETPQEGRSTNEPQKGDCKFIQAGVTKGTQQRWNVGDLLQGSVRPF